MIFVLVGIALVIILAAILLSSSRGGGSASPLSAPITYLPESELGYKVLTNQDLNLEELPKTDEFFVQTWLVRDKIPKWGEWFEVAHNPASRMRGGAVRTMAQDAGGEPVTLEQVFKIIADAMFSLFSGKPTVTPAIIESLATASTPSTAAVKVYSDGSTSLSSVDIAKIVPGVASLLDMDQSNKLLLQQLELAQQAALQPLNSAVAKTTSMGGKVSPSETSAFLAGNYYTVDLDGGYKIIRSGMDTTAIDAIGPGVGGGGDTTFDYMFMIQFETGGLEIFSYTIDDQRVVISNLWTTGTLKCYWESTADMLIASASMAASPLGVRGVESTLVADEIGIHAKPVEAEAERFFNLFDSQMGDDGTVMQLAASGKYDPTRHILTSVYAGVGFIVNLLTLEFAAQYNLAGPPTPILDFTTSAVAIEIDYIASGGTLDSTRQIITLDSGETTARGRITVECGSALTALVAEAPAPANSVVLNKE